MFDKIPITRQSRAMIAYLEEELFGSNLESFLLGSGKVLEIRRRI
jgi:hypothetical protein